jgi:hypothetical protein
MRRFSSLLEPRYEMSVAQQQRDAKEQLAALLQESRFHPWQPGEPIINRGRRILLGVASYSVADLALLDTLNEALEQGSIGPRLDVFNVLECRSIHDFEKYVPGLGKPFQTPVVGYWEEGLLKEKAWGKAGRDLLANVLHHERS